MKNLLELGILKMAWTSVLSIFASNISLSISTTQEMYEFLNLDFFLKAPHCIQNSSFHGLKITKYLESKSKYI
jgi:hypothetical protein